MKRFFSSVSKSAFLNVHRYSLIYYNSFFQSTDKHGITPILAAIWEGHKDCVKLLLDKGAKKEGVAPDGKSYLESAEHNEIKALLA